MPEQPTEAAIYTKQIEWLEKRLAQSEDALERAVTIARQDYHERLKEATHAFDERKQDLLAQNDGMLGAIGRLHSENLNLKECLATAETRMRKAEEALQQMQDVVQRELEEAHQRMDEKADQVKDEAAREIKDLKRQIEELKGKAKKKA